jgi:hypothetical protein
MRMALVLYGKVGTTNKPLIVQIEIMFLEMHFLKIPKK